MSFWPTKEHWSVDIPLRTEHYICPALEATGFVALTPYPGEIPTEEWEGLEYMDWKSGGDTNFAPLASADGTLDCRGFWDKGKTDKDALWTPNAEKAPTLKAYVDSIGANFGRVRIIKLEPQDHEQALKSFHRDDNNRFNPAGTGWVVRTWIEHFTETGCRVSFEIEKLPTGKRVCDGHCDYSLVTLQTGRATRLPEEIRAKYSV